MIRTTALIVCICLAAAPALAQQPTGQSQRRGGLLPDRSSDSAGGFDPTILPQTRVELTRRWDINADGRIDDAEAELARSKMRRERNDLMRRTEIDPLTGRPRGAAPPEPPAAAPSPESLFTTDPPPTFDPRTGMVSGGESGNLGPTDGKPAAAAEQTTPRKRDLNAGRLPAGLPAARGSSSLRAGGPQRPALPQRQSGAILLPPRTGARTQPPMTLPPAAGGRTGMPARPAPMPPARPRITAEEMGGP